MTTYRILCNLTWASENRKSTKSCIFIAQYAELWLCLHQPQSSTTEDGPRPWARKSHSFSFNCKSDRTVSFSSENDCSPWLFPCFLGKQEFENAAISPADGEVAEQTAQSRRDDLLLRCCNTAADSLTRVFLQDKKALLTSKRGERDRPAPASCLQLVQTALYHRTQGEFASRPWGKNVLRQLFPICGKKHL